MEDRPYRAGDKSRSSSTLLTIPNLDKMHVHAELSDVDDGRIHVGMKTRCVLDAYPDRSFVGHVLTISPVARAPKWRSLRRAFDVVVELDDVSEEVMRPGMSVQVELLDSPKEGVLLAPREALRFDADGVAALMADGSETAISISQCSPSQCVIDGLEAGVLLRSRVQR